MNKVIKIEDYPCGSGKTTRMIENFKEDQKYLVILPMLTEVTRVIESSKDIEFVQPHANDNEQGTKTSSLEAQLLLGNNIATTHEMYERLVPMVKAGLVRPTMKWWHNRDEVSDTLSPKILKYAESGCLYLQDGEMFIWALPQCILSAGNSVTVMTYKAEGSMLLSYLRKLGLSFEVSNDNHLEEDFRARQPS